MFICIINKVTSEELYFRGIVNGETLQKQVQKTFGLSFGKNEQITLTEKGQEQGCRIENAHYYDF